MSKTKYYTLKGKAYYAKIWESNREMNTWNPSSGQFDIPATDGGKYTLVLETTESEAQKFRDTGAKSAEYIKYNDNGNPTFKLHRQHEKRDKHGNLLEWASGAPKVKGVPADTVIGNGSDVEVRISVWGRPPSSGHRIEEVTVTNLVEYIPDEEETVEAPF